MKYIIALAIVLFISGLYVMPENNQAGIALVIVAAVFGNAINYNPKG